MHTTDHGKATKQDLKENKQKKTQNSTYAVYSYGKTDSTESSLFTKSSILSYETRPKTKKSTSLYTQSNPQRLWEQDGWRLRVHTIYYKY